MSTEPHESVLLGRCPIDAERDQADEPEDINQGTMKLIVGIIAMSLGAVCTLLAGDWLDSISESYVRGGWPRDVFVGSLFAISVFLLSYLGGSRCEAWLSRIAAVAGFGIALFPCDCVVVARGAQAACEVATTSTGSLPKLHGVCAGTLFVVLALFCRIFYLRAKRKRDCAPPSRPGQSKCPKSGRRMAVYAVCAIGMLGSIAAMGLYWVAGIGHCLYGFVFWAESAGLFSFGAAWLTASKVVPWFANDQERLHPLLRRKARASRS